MLFYNHISTEIHGLPQFISPTHLLRYLALLITMSRLPKSLSILEAASLNTLLVRDIELQ